MARVFHNGKRIRAEIVQRGDRVFVDCSRRNGSVHCGVTDVRHERGKTTIHFSEFGSNPDRLVGHSRQPSVCSLDWYPEEAPAH